ncbi:MAG: hypothetical protein M0Z63_09325 [Actinomycetota bacterium]|nr:hypothetical protein [Actinomycetota bacterium]
MHMPVGWRHAIADTSNFDRGLVSADGEPPVLDLRALRAVTPYGLVGMACLVAHNDRLLTPTVVAAPLNSLAAREVVDAGLGLVVHEFLCPVEGQLPGLEDELDAGPGSADATGTGAAAGTTAGSEGLPGASGADGSTDSEGASGASGADGSTDSEGASGASGADDSSDSDGVAAVTGEGDAPAGVAAADHATGGAVGSPGGIDTCAVATPDRATAGHGAGASACSAGPGRRGPAGGGRLALALYAVHDQHEEDAAVEAMRANLAGQARPDRIELAVAALRLLGDNRRAHAETFDAYVAAGIVGGGAGGPCIEVAVGDAGIGLLAGLTASSREATTAGEVASGPSNGVGEPGAQDAGGAGEPGAQDAGSARKPGAQDAGGVGEPGAQDAGSARKPGDARSSGVGAVMASTGYRSAAAATHARVGDALASADDAGATGDVAAAADDVLAPADDAAAADAVLGGRQGGLAAAGSVAELAARVTAVGGLVLVRTGGVRHTAFATGIFRTTAPWLRGTVVAVNIPVGAMVGARPRPHAAGARPVRRLMRPVR